MTVPAPPDTGSAPDPSPTTRDPDNFDIRADVLLSWLPGWANITLPAVLAWIKGAADMIKGWAGAAQDSATGASDASSAAAASARTASTKAADAATSASGAAASASSATGSATAAATSATAAAASANTASTKAADAATSASGAATSATSATGSATAAATSATAAATSANASAGSAATAGAQATASATARAAAEAARDAALRAQSTAVAVVTGGTGSLTAAAAKLPLADASGKLHESWATALQVSPTQSLRAALDQVDVARNALVKNLVTKNTLVFDRTKRLSKGLLIGTGAELLDPNDSTKSQWVQVFPNDKLWMYVTGGRAVLLNLPVFYVAPPGYYEAPVRYAVDQSTTFGQFVFANSTATSAEINSCIEQLKLPLRTFGGWNEGSLTNPIPVLQVPGKHPYSGLFVRFVNLPAFAGATAQAVNTFGGHTSFILNTAEYFPNINYMDVL